MKKSFEKPQSFYVTQHVYKIKPFEPDHLFQLRISVSGDTFKPDHLFRLRISVSGDTFVEAKNFRAVHLFAANGGRTIFVEPFIYSPPAVGGQYFQHGLFEYGLKLNFFTAYLYSALPVAVYGFTTYLLFALSVANHFFTTHLYSALLVAVYFLSTNYIIPLIFKNAIFND